MKIFNKDFKKLIVFLLVFVMNISPLTVLASTEVIITDPTPDITAPVLNSLSISSTQAASGDKITLSANITDDLSGVGNAYLYYKKPSGNSELAYFSLNQTTGLYEASITFSDYSEDGAWVLSGISISDKKNNNLSYAGVNGMDLTPYSIQVIGSKDVTPPTVGDITISPSQATVGSTVKIAVDATDDLSGVYIGQADITTPSGRYRTIYCHYNSSTGKYEGTLTIDQYDEIGTWKISDLTFRDKTGNSKTVYNSTSYDPSKNTPIVEYRDLSNCNFEVSGTKPDLIAATLDSLAISLVNGVVVKLTGDFTDILSGFSNAYVYYVKPSGKYSYYYFSKNNTSGKYELSIPIDKYDELGTWKLQSIGMYDSKGNQRTIYDSTTSGNLDTKDLSSFNFIVRGAVTIPPAAPFSIGMTPIKTTLEQGTSKQLSVTLNMTDGTTKDITSGTSGTIYTSSNPSSVKVSQDGLITVEPNAGPGTVYIQAANGGIYGQCEVVIPGVVSESYLQISPLSMSLSAGQSKQLSVIASLADGTVKDVTSASSGITYSSSDITKVQVDQNGLIKVLASAAQGTVKVQVKYGDITGESTITVAGPPAVKSVVMTPAEATVSFGETVQLSVRGTLTDGSTKDVTDGANGTVYTVSDTRKATVDSNGLVTISSNATSGQITVIATNNGTAAKSLITINGVPAIEGIEITPITDGIFPNTTHQLVVKAKYSDGSTKDITASTAGTTYKSGNSYATVDAEGKVTISPTAVVGGVVKIYAYNGSCSNNIPLTIAEDTSIAKSTGIKIESDSSTYIKGSTYQLKVLEEYSNGSTKDITASSAGTTYKSGNSYATVDGEGNVTISPTAVVEGIVKIYAYNGSYSNNIALTIGEDTSIPKLTGIKIGSDSSTYVKGSTYQLKVLEEYSDGSTKDITASTAGTTYKSANSYATVDVEGKVTISPTAVVGGIAKIYAYNGSYSNNIALTVGEDTSAVKPTGIKIESAESTYLQGQTYQMKVLTVNSDGSTKDITASSEGTTYKSANSYATVDVEGKVTISPTALVGGLARIYAYNGSYSNNIALTVGEDTSVVKPTGIKIESTESTYMKGNTYQIKVLEQYSDGTTKDITASSEGTTYKSANSYATVDGEGKVTISPTAVAGGVARIYAYNGTYSSNIALTVSEDLSTKLVSISLSETTTSLKRSATYQLSLNATYGDGTTKDITASSAGTTYKSGNSYAKVDAEGKITISPTALIGGVVTVYAYNSGKRADFKITISP